MKFSKATNYALHTMLFLSISPLDKPIGVQQLAEKQRVSPSYLSKILSNLVKAGMVESTSGMNGGYRLKRNWEDISFFDIIQAIEGTASLFDCDLNHGPGCLIQQIMLEAEQKMELYLKSQKISEVAKKKRRICGRALQSSRNILFLYFEEYIMLNSKVITITKKNTDKMKSANREVCVM